MKRFLLFPILLCILNIYAQKYDWDIYPADSLKGKGILVNLDIGKEHMYDSIWWLSKGDYNLILYYDKEIILDTLNISRTNPLGRSVFRDFVYEIPIAPIRVYDQDDEFYHISMHYPRHSAMRIRELPIPNIRIKKKDADSRGLTYISMEYLLETYKSNNFYTLNPVGADVYPPVELITPEPEADTLGAKYSPHPFFSFFTLKNSPSLSSPFLSIIEPGAARNFRYEIISKEGYWYKLKTDVFFRFGGIFWDAGYTGGSYTGYWQAPYDENGFPYILLDMVQDRGWPQIIEKLRIGLNN